MNAIHGGTATHDTIDAQNIAVLLRGGMLPQAYVYPAKRRATRDWLRRRLQLTRHRAERLTHGQQTHWQSNLPEIGQQLAYQANRDGVAERVRDPAVQQRVEVDLALIDSDEQLLSEVELSIVQMAKPHHAQTLYRLPSVPGIGKMLRLVLLDEIHDIPRFPRVQEFVSYCRLGTWAKEAAGTRDGTSGATIGHTSLKWAFSEAAGLFLRNHPAAQPYLARLEPKHGKGNALTILAHQWARAVSYLLKRDTVFDMQKFLSGEGSGAGEPTAYRDAHGLSLACGALLSSRRQGTRRSPEALWPRSRGL
jgi:transposase